MKLVATIALVFAAGADLPASDGAERARQAAAGEHWAFRPLRYTTPPAVTQHEWVRTPIDQFILAKLEAVNLKPAPTASREALIRRITFDLTGLPPTPHEIEAFLRDNSNDACERLIDRLLASTAYGQRWAQHWLDIARFAETDGFEHDLVRPNAWRYRDWVIDSLNADMPYDSFVRMQIAGDEWTRRHKPMGASADADAHGSPDDKILRDPRANVATGFLICGPDMPDINLQDERRHNVLNEMTSAVGSVFLGLQLGCAQCHDHKFDPITIADFYRMRAFFDPAEFFDEYPLASPQELAERERQQAPIKAQQQRIEADLKKFDLTAHQRLNKDPQVKISRDELLSALSETEREEFQNLTEQLQQLKTSSTQMAPLPMGRVMRETGGTPRPSHVMLRGDFRQPGPRVNPAFPAIANLTNTPLEVDPDVAPSSGRRTALARWLTQADHPLTTRVIVNRVWQFHFGHGLSRTPSDFGTMGEAPSHPELLDWLAITFTRPREEGGCGWSLKSLHKLMLNSATYRQSSRRHDEPHRAQIDPDNRLLGRMNRLRLDGESIRDAMLAAAGRLSTQRGGPGVRPPLPDELVATLLKGQWVTSPDEEDHRRRSIYIFVRRNLRYPILDVFDRPDTNASCPQRNRSTTAPQGLALLNSAFSLSVARDLAGLILSEAGADMRAQIDLGYRRTLGRAPTDDEMQASMRFLVDQSSRIERDGRPAAELAVPEHVPAGMTPQAAAALTDFCLALVNLNEFVYLD